jgi:hypothetical protein
VTLAKLSRQDSRDRNKSYERNEANIGTACKQDSRGT